MITSILDETLLAFQSGDIQAALRGMSSHLHEIRQREPDDRWNMLVKPVCALHPLNQILLADPFTRRAREKPRGYAGDAEMIDYVYRRTAPVGTSELGGQIFAFTTDAPAGQAVRWRMQYLTKAIDECAQHSADSRVLSLACGHLREVEQSAAAQSGRVAELHAIDQDQDSLAVIERDYGHLPCVRISKGNVRPILKTGLPANSFHLAYAAGLYDYLNGATAEALTVRLFESLAPGGRLIVPNFLHSNFDRGYMECFMDWNLIVRTRDEIEAIGNGLPMEHVADQRYFEDPYAVIGYLEVMKRS